MEHLDNRAADRVQHLFAAPHLALLVDAVAAGNSPARIWVDAADAPATALIWDGFYSFYLGGAVDRPAEWRDLLDREVLPGREFLKADAAGGAVLAGIKGRWRDRVFLRGGPPPPVAPGAFRVDPIDDDRLALVNGGEVRAEIAQCWPAPDDFRRAGFGFVAHDGTTIASWCTAEYVSDGKCGIGIETVKAYQGRGLATRTAHAFVTHCAERGVTPHWDAWADNAPSLAVARKVGFREVDTYRVFVVDGRR